jgi:cardiolipin synthase
MSLPNVLTVIRLMLVPVVGYLLLTGRFGVAGAVFAVAALTDALDGWLARRLNQITRLGQLLDPIADKALVNTVMVASAMLGLLPFWFALLVLVRDVLVIASCCVTRALGLGSTFLPGAVGKAAVAMQMVILALVLLPLPGWAGAPRLATLLIPLSAALTVISALLYVRAWLRRDERRAS